jgi:hypothetical protein
VGTGNLRIGIPLANVMASGRGAALTLTRLDGRQVGSYSGLVVRDATGRLVPSIMFYSAPRHQVIIDVFDGHARYPLSIDPTWNMASSAIPDPVAAAQDQFGISVAISGTNAVVGARGTNNSRGAVYFYSLVGGAWTLNTASTTGTTPGEIIDPAATNNDFFGYSVAISGTNAVVGAFYTSTRRGAAYFYSLVAGVWTRNTEVTDPAATSGDQFGVSVAISGTNAVIGAYVTGDDDGAVYFYSLVGGTWTLNTASGTSGEVTVLGATNLGISVAISGTNAVAGAFATDSNEGAAYFFSLVAGTWSPSGGIDDPAVTGGDYFGYSVAISGTNAVVGAFGTNNEGAAYFYSLVTGTWTRSGGSDDPAPFPASGDNFGYSVAISGTNAVVGSNGTSNGGAGYFYSLAGGAWTLNTASGTSGEVTDPAATSGDQFGVSVAISGTNAVAGAYGTSTSQGDAYFYSLVGGAWTLNTASGTSGEVTDPAAVTNDEFGYSVAISGTNAVVGAPGTNSFKGAVYFYSLVGGAWTLNTVSGTGGEITDPAATNYDDFGRTVAISGTNAVVGAYGTSTSQGAVYFYSLVGGAWTLNTVSGTGGKINDPAATTNDQFGVSVAISGTNAVVGARGTSTSQGVAYFYSFVAGAWTLNTASGTSGEVTDPAATSGDNFGYSVAISGTNAVVGAYGTSSYQGATYFYSLVGGAWTLNTASGTSGEVTDPAEVTNDEFGYSVAISGTNAVVGAPGTNVNRGAAYFYSLVGGTWTLNTASGTSGEINDPAADTNDNFGYSVAISGTNAVVGSNGTSNGGTGYFYSLVASAWTLNTASGTGGEVTDPAAVSYDEFGSSVAISGTNAVVAAPDTNSYQGATYFYSLAATYSVTYANGGGTGTLPTQASEPDGGTFSVASGSGLSKNGDNFAGWSDGANTYQPNATYTMGSSAVTLTALWAALPPRPSGSGGSSPTDSVSFDSEGGSAVATITGADGSSVNLPTPTFAAHAFLGWSTSSSGGTLVTSPLTLTAPSMTLYAQWSSNTVVSSNPPKPAPSYRVIGVIRSFAIGSSVLTTALKVQIQHLAALIESKHFDDVMLRGNATLPVSAANRKLAETRAVVVETYLKQLGVHANFKIQFTVSGLVDFYLSVSALAK